MAVSEKRESVRALPKHSKVNCAGFKSVFSIADRVSIYSNGFNFCLDRTRRLGMISPILLDTVPSFVSDDWTVTVMDLSLNDEDYDLVKTTLQQTHPEMLLFTRRLRKINISFESQFRNKFEPTEYCVYTPNPEFPCVHAIRGGNSEQATNYFVHKMQVDDMPDHSSRPGVRESGIVLAFPFTETEGPMIADQHIFAFMPLRETSLPVNPLAS